MKRNATELRKENHGRHPAWEWDDRIIALLEQYEDKIIALEERIELLEYDKT